MYSPIFSDEIHIFLQDPRALTLVPSRTLADGPRMGFFITSFKHQKWQNKRNRAASLVAFCRNETCRNEITFYLAEITGMFRGFQDPPATTIPWLLVESFCFLRWKITKNWQTIDFTIRNMGISWEFHGNSRTIAIIFDWSKMGNWGTGLVLLGGALRTSGRLPDPTAWLGLRMFIQKTGGKNGKIMDTIWLFKVMYGKP